MWVISSRKVRKVHVRRSSRSEFEPCAILCYIGQSKITFIGYILFDVGPS
jgi:hypothetical protein